MDRRAFLAGPPALIVAPYAAALTPPRPTYTHHWGKFRFGTLEQRIAAHCTWFDLPPPVLAYDETGAVLLSDELLEWAYDAGGSLDWLLAGEAKGMATVYRILVHSCSKGDFLHTAT